MIDLLIMILAIIPAISFQKKYRLIPLTEFKIFSLLFYSVVLSVAGELGAIVLDIAIFYQIQFLALISIYFLIYVYALRVHFQKSPKFLKLAMILFFSILTVLILFWETMEQPNKGMVLFWEVSATRTAYYPSGAGLMINDVIILSTSYYLIVTIFILICLIWYLFALSTIDLVIVNKKIQRARILWVLVVLINILWVFLVFPWTPNYNEANVLIVIQLFLIIYIVVKIPQGMIISNSQFVRSYDLLFDLITRESHTMYADQIGNSSFFEYLELVMNILKNQSDRNE